MRTWGRHVPLVAVGLALLVLSGCSSYAVVKEAGPITSKTFPPLVDEAEVMGSRGPAHTKAARIGAFSLVPSERRDHPEATLGEGKHKEVMKYLREVAREEAADRGATAIWLLDVSNVTSTPASFDFRYFDRRAPKVNWTRYLYCTELRVTLYRARE